MEMEYSQSTHELLNLAHFDFSWNDQPDKAFGNHPNSHASNNMNAMAAMSAMNLGSIQGLPMASMGFNQVGVTPFQQQQHQQQQQHMGQQQQQHQQHMGQDMGMQIPLMDDMLLNDMDLPDHVMEQQMAEQLGGDMMGDGLDMEMDVDLDLNYE